MKYSFGILDKRIERMSYSREALGDARFTHLSLNPNTICIAFWRSIENFLSTKYSYLVGKNHQLWPDIPLVSIQSVKISKTFVKKI